MASVEHCQHARATVVAPSPGLHICRSGAAVYGVTARMGRSVGSRGGSRRSQALAPSLSGPSRRIPGRTDSQRPAVPMALNGAMSTGVAAQPVDNRPAQLHDSLYSRTWRSPAHVASCPPDCLVGVAVMIRTTSCCVVNQSQWAASPVRLQPSGAPSSKLLVD
jgi:hypothetical protein